MNTTQATQEVKRYKQQAKVRAAKPGRMKHVFHNDEIPHLWAHKTQSSARNAKNSLHFDGDIIYSYCEPIASHYTNKRGDRAVLVSNRTFSVTTSRHQGQVRSAIPPSLTVFNVPQVTGDSWTRLQHPTNAKAYEEDLATAIKQASKARLLNSKEWKTGYATKLRKEYIGYCKFFGLKVPKTLPDVPKLTAAIVRKLKEREAYLASEPAQVKRAAEKVKRDARKAELIAKANADSIAAWREGNAYARVPRGLPVMLRICGEDVETSLGARVPLDHAKRVLDVVRKVVARGEAFVANGHTIAIGVYKVDRIEADGTLVAGCHVIPYAEIEALGVALDATPAQA